MEEERERAFATYRRDRDPLALEAAMRDLDAAEADARSDREGPPPPPAEVRRYLENLPSWWAEADTDDRRVLAATLFERIGVLGISRVELDPTQEARDHGLADAFGRDEVVMVGARGLETTITFSSPDRPSEPMEGHRRSIHPVDIEHKGSQTRVSVQSWSVA